MSGLLVVLGIVAFLVGIVAVCIGHIRWLAISSRKIATAVLIGGFAVFIIGGTMLPKTAQPALAGATVPPAPVTTTVAPPTTTTVPPPPTTVAPVITTVVAPPPVVTQAPQQPAPPPVPAELDCTATVSNSSPHHNQTTVIEVSTTPGAHVDVEVEYKTTSHEKTATASSRGSASIPYDISTATYDHQVDVEIAVSRGDQQGNCSTSFTPEP